MRISFFIIFFFSFFSITSYARSEVKTYISEEVGFTNQTARFTVDELRTEWLNATIESGACSEPGDIETFDLTASAVVANQALFTIGTVGVIASNRDMDGPLQGSPGGNVSLDNSGTLQDGAPRPASLFDGTPLFYNEVTGSGASRNAILFEFDSPVRSFGAWFGDLETRSAGAGLIPAFVRIFDTLGNQIGSDIEIPVSQLWLNSYDPPGSEDESSCNAAIFRGCGNRTTRWIGFVADEDTQVGSFLIVVGDDDLGGDALSEHISMIGPTLAKDYSCGDADIEIKKFDAGVPLIAESPIVYNIVAINHGPADATNVVVTDELPSGVEFSSAVSTNGGSCTENSGTITCNLGTLIAGNSSVVITVVASSSSSGDFINNAVITSDISDPDISNNSSSVTTQIQESPTGGTTGTPAICVTSDLSSSSFVIDGAAQKILDQFNAASSLLRSLKRKGACSNSVLNDVKALKSQAESIFDNLWAATWSALPQVSFECSGSVETFCTSTETTSTKASIRNFADELRALVGQILSPNCINSNKKARGIRRKVRKANKELLQELDLVAEQVLGCNL